MDPNTSSDAPTALSESKSLAEFESGLLVLYGPVLGGQALGRALGYPSPGAFAKANERKRVPVPTFTIPGRRGRFAATSDLAAWLWRQRQGTARD